MATPRSYTGPLPAVAAFQPLYVSYPIFSGSGGGPVSPVPLAAVLKGGSKGVAYSETMSGFGGTPPYTFALTSGSLPTGTSLNTSTGVISGTPSAIATYSFTIKVTDNLGAFNSFSFQITITDKPPSGNSAYSN